MPCPRDLPGTHDANSQVPCRHDSTCPGIAVKLGQLFSVKLKRQRPVQPLVATGRRLIASPSSLQQAGKRSKRGYGQLEVPTDINPHNKAYLRDVAMGELADRGSSFRLAVRPVVRARVAAEVQRLRPLHGIGGTLDHVGRIRSGTIDSIPGASRRDRCKQESETDEAAATRAQCDKAHDFVSSQRAVLRARGCLRRSVESPGRNRGILSRGDGRGLFYGSHRFYPWLRAIRWLVLFSLLSVPAGLGAARQT